MLHYVKPLKHQCLSCMQVDSVGHSFYKAGVRCVPLDDNRREHALTTSYCVIYTDQKTLVTTL